MIRHLIYHVCPLAANDGWRENVEQLLQYWDVFTGRRIVAVVHGRGLHPLQTVQDAFGRDAVEWLTLPNDPQLREVATFLPLLEAVRTDAADATEAVFYAHTKGNSTKDGEEAAALWRTAMYDSLLGYAEQCDTLLRMFPAVGCCKFTWNSVLHFPWPSGLRHALWMFAGTFFWFRSDVIFGRPNWRDVPRDRYGAEAWLGGVLGQEEAISIYQPWPDGHWANPYRAEWYREARS